MNDKTVTNLDRALARFSVKCLVCSRAPAQATGFCFLAGQDGGEAPLSVLPRL